MSASVVVNMCAPASCGFDQWLHDQDFRRAVRLTVATGDAVCITLMCGCPFIGYPREVG